MNIPDRLIPQSEISGRITWATLEITNAWAPDHQDSGFIVLDWGPGIGFKKSVDGSTVQ